MEYVTVRSKAWDEIVEAAGNEQHFEQTLQEIIPSKRESGILPRDGRPVPIFNLHDRSIPLAAFGLVKSKTLLANLKTLAKKKHVAQALQVANGIWDARVKFRALMEIAEATGEKQHYDLALQVANNFKDAREKSEALLEIVKTTIEKQYYDLALQVANNFKDAREKSMALLEIAEATRGKPAL